MNERESLSIYSSFSNVRATRLSNSNAGPVAAAQRDDDDAFYLFLQKQQLAQRFIPIGYLPPLRD